VFIKPYISLIIKASNCVFFATEPLSPRAWSFSISRIENTLSGAKAKRKHFEVGVWVFRKHLNIFYLKSRENILQNPIQPLHCTFRNQPNLAAFFIINAF